MRDTDLFRMALGIEPPWVVTKSDFDAAAKRLDIHLDFARGSRFACPQCGIAGCLAYDSEEKTWRQLNFFQHEAYLHARVPRVTCTSCGIKQVSVPWARPDSGFTLLFEALVMAMVQAMPVAAVARMIDEWDTRLWRVIHHYVEAARDRADHSEVASVAGACPRAGQRPDPGDETASRRGHNYVSLFVDLVRRRVLFVAEGKDAGTVEAFAKDLAAHGGTPAAIAEVCIDMSPAFIAGTAQSLPNARITFDKFHVIKLINEAVDAVRRAEQKSRAELKKSRYLWLRNPRNLSQRQRAQLDSLSAANLKTGRAYRIRLAFQELYLQPAKNAEAFLKKWYWWATHSRLPPMIETARMVKRHWNGILRWFHTKIANGIMEAVNSLVQAAKAKARGYRSVRNLKAIIYLIAGKLELPLPT
jgi:transposase